MSALGLALVLTAAVCHAGWNFLAKRIHGGAELVWLFSVLSSAIYLPLAVWVYTTEAYGFTAQDWLFIGGSAVLHLFYFVLLQAGYRNGDLSVVYPTARSMGPLVAMVLAALVLGEYPSLQGGIGAAIIIGGVFALTGGGRGGGGRPLTSVLFGLGVGCLIGSYTTWDAYAVSVLAVPPLLMDYGTNLGRGLLLSPIALRRRALVAQHWRNHRAGVLGIAVLSPLAYILVLYAMSFTPVAYVAPLREVSVLLAVLAGSLLLGEGHLRFRLTWAAVILCGVVVLATS
jgi:drug/metabolite transporter (DMT)-like permease